MLREAGIITEGNLYDIFNVAVVHHVQQSLRAHTLFTRDVDYIVRDDKVVIIDEFTGRMMEGRRYSEGLHQALEAKEGVTVQPENQTLASITFQNYFRLYPKLAGMTGTAHDRGRRVRGNLQARRGGDPDQRRRSSARTRTTRSIAPPARNTRRVATLIEDARSAASRCWSAPPASRRASCSASC